MGYQGPEVAVLSHFKEGELSMRHTIFGEVISGYDVVQRIESASTDSSDRPLKEQKIIKAILLCILQ